ncbi:hypothetical protein [Fulvimarina sp. MAC8]|uniref:hypothetical protein n=1 Tax=Fulvimarina sp. MAC8 TaxID=3162874 RepID=UPI0032EF9D95
MTIDTAGAAKPSFGVGGRIGETFSIFGSRFGIFAGIGIVWGLITQIPTYLALGTIPTVTDSFDPGTSSPMQTMMIESPLSYVVVFFLLPTILYALMTGMLTLAAYDARTGRAPSMARYIAAAIKQSLWLIVLTILVSIIMGIGFALFLIPGLWLLGVFGPFVPVLMIEKLGFGTLGRTKQLTKEYRWPIVGFLVLVYIVVIVGSLVVGFLGALLPGVIFFLLQGAVAGFTTAIFSIATAVCYARLREIKEGVGFDDLADVFA